MLVSAIIPAGEENIISMFSDILDTILFEYQYILKDGYVFSCYAYDLKAARDKRDYFFTNVWGK